jgi:hypothetical protein
VIYSGLTSLYLYLGYYCYKYKVDTKYLTLNTFVIPPALMVVGMVNVIMMSSGDTLVDYEEIITNVIHLLLVLVMTCSDFVTLRETRDLAKRHRVAVSRFEQEPQRNILASVWTRIRGFLHAEATLPKAVQSGLMKEKEAKLTSKRVSKRQHLFADLIAELERKAIDECKISRLEGTAVRNMASVAPCSVSLCPSL